MIRDLFNLARLRTLFAHVHRRVTDGTRAVLPSRRTTALDGQHHHPDQRLAAAAVPTHPGAAHGTADVPTRPASHSPTATPSLQSAAPDTRHRHRPAQPLATAPVPVHPGVARGTADTSIRPARHNPAWSRSDRAFAVSLTISRQAPATPTRDEAVWNRTRKGGCSVRFRSAADVRPFPPLAVTVVSNDAAPRLPSPARVLLACRKAVRNRIRRGVRSVRFRFAADVRPLPPLAVSVGPNGAAARSPVPATVGSAGKRAVRNRTREGVRSVRFQFAAALALISPLGASASGADRAPTIGSVTRAPYSVTAGGLPVDRYLLTNARGARVAILTYGATIDRVEMPERSGTLGDVVLRLPDLAAHEAHANVGNIVGRFANRISGGGFTLDGHRYDLSPDRSAVISHGGKPGWGERVWRASPCATRGCSAVTLRYTSPDGENGFPGRVEASVTYTLTPDDALRIDYRATTNRPTVVNLTNHSYFNLAGGGTVADHRLQLLADAVLAVDARKVPTGTLTPVAGTAFDLRHPARIGDRIDADDPAVRAARGFDHNWVLARTRRPALPVVARLVDPASGRTLEVRTDQPGVQVYTANSWTGAFADAHGRPLARAAGVALETQGWPDSPNQPGFPSTVLRPGRPFRSTTIYRFGVTTCTSGPSACPVGSRPDAVSRPAASSQRSVALVPPPVR
jgi:aldose 1-epimerase